MNPYLLSATCVFGFMCVLFLIAQLKKDNSIVDIGWGIGFILVTVVILSVYGDGIFRQRLTSYLVIIWGVRLSFYIFIRHLGKPEDFRYANWRREWGNHVASNSFFKVFMLQGLVMFIMVLPVIVVDGGPPLFKQYALISALGFTVWAVGFFFEAISDWQMYSFKSDPHPHREKVLSKGLWKYSRHPNYFGEAVMWWGIFIIAIPAGQWYISMLSPITITFLLLRISGVTMLEKKYEDNDEYTQYKRSTNAFFPWLPKQA